MGQSEAPIEKLAANSSVLTNPSSHHVARLFSPHNDVYNKCVFASLLYFKTRVQQLNELSGPDRSGSLQQPCWVGLKLRGLESRQLHES